MRGGPNGELGTAKSVRSVRWGKKNPNPNDIHSTYTNEVGVVTTHCILVSIIPAQLYAENQLQ